MAPADAAQRATGYVLGGISPLGQRRRLPTVVDAAALSLPRIHVSAGRRGLELALAPADLVRLCGATTAPIAR
jgi:Cys-tRNA(Pro)/Cys-tRNA(Cys) deacylase